MKNKNLLIVIIGVISLLVGGAAGFFGGMKYQQGKTPTRGQFANMMFQRNGMGNRLGATAMAVRGAVISADNNSITVKMQDGSTKIVILSSTTMIGKTTSGTASDLINGSNVTIFGNTNSDGTITAQNVQIGNGILFGGRPMGSPTANPTNQ